MAGGRGTSAHEAALRTDRLDQVFQNQAGSDTPGFAVAVAVGGEVVYARGFGMATLEYPVPITPDTVFHAASVSKQFTAMAVVMLEQEGRLALDDDVGDHLAWAPDYGNPIRLRHLVHHTSGIRDEWTLAVLSGIRLDDVITNQDLVDLLASQRSLNFPPGTRYAYSNSNYTLLALVVEAASGMTFPDFCQARIFDPLGMARTHVHADNRWVVPGRAYSYDPAPGGGYLAAPLNFANFGPTSLFTTASDLMRWAANFETAAVGGTEGVWRLKEAGRISTGEAVDYAFGLVTSPVGGAATLWHSGSDAGFRAHFLLLPEARVAVAVLGNSSAVAAGNLVVRAAQTVLGRGLEPAGEPDFDGDLWERLAALEGTYRNPQSRTTIRLRLEAGMPVIRGAETLPLRSLGGLRFRVDTEPGRHRRQGKAGLRGGSRPAGPARNPL